MVSDAVVGICGNVVKELVDGVVGGFRGGGLLLDQFAENYQYFFCRWHDRSKVVLTQ